MSLGAMAMQRTRIEWVRSVAAGLEASAARETIRPPRHRRSAKIPRSSDGH